MLIIENLAEWQLLLTKQQGVEFRSLWHSTGQADRLANVRYVQVWVLCTCAAGPGCGWSHCRMGVGRRGGCALALSPPRWLLDWEPPAALPSRRWR